MNTKSTFLLAAIVVVAAVSSLVVTPIQFALASSGGASDFSPGKQKSASGLKDASDSSPGAQVKAPTDPFRDASQFAPGLQGLDG